MASALATLFWQQIKLGNFTYAQVIPDSMKAEVKALAKLDVQNGVISENWYAELIGEPYEA